MSDVNASVRVDPIPVDAVAVPVDQTNVGRAPNVVTVENPSVCRKLGATATTLTFSPMKGRAITEAKQVPRYQSREDPE